jgi:hypothetical protein
MDAASHASSSNTNNEKSSKNWLAGLGRSFSKALNLKNSNNEIEDPYYFEGQGGFGRKSPGLGLFSGSDKRRSTSSSQYPVDNNDAASYHSSHRKSPGFMEKRKSFASEHDGENISGSGGPSLATSGRSKSSSLSQWKKGLFGGSNGGQQSSGSTAAAQQQQLQQQQQMMMQQQQLQLQQEQLQQMQQQQMQMQQMQNGRSGTPTGKSASQATAAITALYGPAGYSNMMAGTYESPKLSKSGSKASWFFPGKSSDNSALSRAKSQSGRNMNQQNQQPVSVLSNSSSRTSLSKNDGSHNTYSTSNSASASYAQQQPQQEQQAYIQQQQQPHTYNNSSTAADSSSSPIPSVASSAATLAATPSLTQSPAGLNLGPGVAYAGPSGSPSTASVASSGATAVDSRYSKFYFLYLPLVFDPAF